MNHKPKRKSFPWLCPRCLEREVRPAEVPYNADVTHDGKTHAVEISALVVPRCDTCGELIFGNDTDWQISRALRNALGLLQPDEIRSLRKKLGLTQWALAECLGIPLEMISRWESGLVIQSRIMDRLLRDKLGAEAEN